jgi:hypothetical protein
MDVRVKFYCTQVVKQFGGKYNDEGKYEPGVVYSYEFSVVASGSEENKKFFASTPSGKMSITAFRDDLFEIGKEYYADLSPAF